MIVNLTNPNGTKLFTKGTIVNEDITIIPNLPGGGGECDKPHVIEVDVLPTENIDENAVYLCGGRYYKYVAGGDTETWKFNDGIVMTGALDAVDESSMAVLNDVNNLMKVKFNGEEKYLIPMCESGMGIIRIGLTSIDTPLADETVIYEQTGSIIVLDNLSGVTMEILSIGIFSEWLNANATLISGVGGWKEWIPKEECGGGAELNIAYGDTPPEDTSKLWVKCDTPEAVQIVPPALVGANATATTSLEGSIETLSTTLPTVIDRMPSAVVGTKVYLFGGGNGSSYLNTINVFDAETNRITTLSTTLPTGASNVASATIGTKVYLFGGSSSGGRLNTINEFDTETEQIETLSTTLPKLMSFIASAVVGTKVYLFGGYGGSNLNTINVFDAETNRITTLSTTLPKAAQYIASGVVGTKIYLFGGRGDDSYLNTINVFDTETEQIETLSTTLPTAADGMPSATIGTKVYLFGGVGSGGRLNTINVFEAPSGVFYLAMNNMLIASSLDKNLFALLPNMIMGFETVYLGNENNEGEAVEAALYTEGTWTSI